MVPQITRQSNNASDSNTEPPSLEENKYWQSDSRTFESIRRPLTTKHCETIIIYIAPMTAIACPIFGGDLFNVNLFDKFSF